MARHRSRATRFVQAGLAGGLLAAGALAADRAEAQFASQVNLVEVYATVTDQTGQPVKDLKLPDFQVFEDGEPQTITTFAAGEFPLSAALAIDRSWSMSGRRLELAAAAARSFLGELGPEDRSMIIAIGAEIEVVSPLSTDRSEQRGAVNALDPWSTTALHDAIIAAIERIQPAEGRRALILLSDGTDRYSRATAAEALERARRSDVMIYPIALGKTRPELFAELAVLTGGRSLHVQDPVKLESTLVGIARELRHQYLLGYTPERPLEGGEGEWRSIQVKVNRPGVRVRARDGYLVKEGPTLVGLWTSW